MRILPINSFQNYTTNRNNSSKQTSFKAVEDVITNDGFDLQNSEGVEVLKALYQNRGTRQFFSEHNVVLNFQRVPLQSGGWETRMHVYFTDEPYRNSAYYRLGSAKEKFDVTRYKTAKEVVKKITYDELEKSTTTELQKNVKMQNLQKEEEAVKEYNRVLKDLANL